MAIFEAIEELLKKISDINEYSKALVTLASAVGVLIFFLYTIRISIRLIRQLRLYVFSQYCCQTDFAKKYGQWAVISGATDGIGQSMAKELARRGMSILVISRNEEKLARTKAMLEQEPNVGEVETIKIDLSDSSIENFARIRDKVDPENRDIGLLINNAGAFPDKFARFNRFELEEIVSLVNLNVLGTVHLTRMIMPGMLQRGRGMVVNVSSILGSVAGPYLSLYGATKAFVNSFTKQLQIEYASHPIDIRLIEPGPVSTNPHKAAFKVTRPSIMVPYPDEFAKSCVNALSTGIQSFNGTMMHEITSCTAKLCDKLGILPWFSKIGAATNGKNYQISPVLQRKQMSANST